LVETGSDTTVNRFLSENIARYNGDLSLAENWHLKGKRKKTLIHAAIYATSEDLL
jgi:hypothetical protein